MTILDRNQIPGIAGYDPTAYSPGPANAAPLNFPEYTVSNHPSIHQSSL